MKARERLGDHGIPERGKPRRCVVQGCLCGARVVKALDTVGAHIMVDPSGVTGDQPTMFIVGDDEQANVR